LGTYAVYDGTRLFLAKRAERAENSSQSIANEDLWEDWRKRRVKNERRNGRKDEKNDESGSSADGDTDGGLR
jgi:hypothetical protein